MRYLLSLFISIVLLGCSTAQTGTEVYLFDVSNDGETWSLSNPLNVSQNVGYDNQPSFSPDGTILYFTSNRNGETDLVAYDIGSGGKTWVTETAKRSEYSPTITPDGNHISFISLTNEGVQEFRKINVETRVETLIEDDPIIGYFVWIDDESYLSFVLANEDQPSTLQIHNSETGEKTILGENPGRSFHKIPGSKAVSYIQTIHEAPEIFGYYFVNESTEFIHSTLSDSQDMAWLPSGEILMGLGSKLFIASDSNWLELVDLSNFDLTGISRLAANSTGTKLAIVVEE